MKVPHTQGQFAVLLALALLLLAAAVLPGAAPVTAQSDGDASAAFPSEMSGAGYTLNWNTIDGGGTAFSVGGRYGLAGTIGQADAGQLAGRRYTLVGGFWGGPRGLSSCAVYLPIVLRGFPR
jgi:hypothetical protein